MSCPIVAGIIAQWMEAVPTLTREQVIETFAASCHHHDPSLTYPNNDYGYGEIDAEAGLEYLLSKPDGIEEIFNGKQTKDKEIYNLAGQRLAKPQKGINIVGGRKIVKW